MLTQEAVGISEVKRSLTTLVRRLQSGEQARVIVFKQNRPVAVMLPMGVYERLEALEADIEHLEDALSIGKAEAINDGTTWSLQEVREKLGLSS